MIIFKRSDAKNLSRLWWQSDKIILLCIFFLIFLGITLILTASMFVAVRIGADGFYFFKNQLLYLFISLFIMFFIATRKKEHLVIIAILGILISMLLMVYIIFFGQEVKGAKRWIYFLGFSLQPSEFMKVFFPVIFAFIFEYLNNKKQNIIFTYVVLSGFYVIAVMLLLLQPDIGMTILVTMVFSALLFLTGIKLIWIIVLGAIGVLLLLFSYFTFSHVNYRVNSFLFDQNTYQVSKSIQGIKEGAIFGKGPGQGVVKQYLPDSHTDFIFTVGMEEFGLILGLLIMSTYLMLLYRSYKLAIKQNDVFKFLSIIGLSFLIFMQAMIHIASNINLIPTKGMTLPLISYGGSSLVSLMIATGFLIALTKKDINSIKLYQDNKDAG